MWKNVEAEKKLFQWDNQGSFWGEKVVWLWYNVRKWGQNIKQINEAGIILYFSYFQDIPTMWSLIHFCLSKPLSPKPIGSNMMYIIKSG